jgi:hypothetical protein
MGSTQLVHSALWRLGTTYWDSEIAQAPVSTGSGHVPQKPDTFTELGEAGPWRVPAGIVSSRVRAINQRN